MLSAGVTYVPCEADCISDNKYKILANDEIDLENDATSIWSFFPGDIVSCKIIDHSYSYSTKRSEEILVADKLIEFSESFPNRKLFQLIYLIVQSLGNLSIEQFQYYQKEVKLLCSSKLFQRNHPVIKEWMAMHCK